MSINLHFNNGTVFTAAISHVKNALLHPHAIIFIVDAIVKPNIQVNKEKKTASVQQPTWMRTLQSL